MTARLPNILLITTDEQRYDTLGVTGNRICRAANIDALASRGTLFSHGYIQNPVCIPSPACIMTGRYVHQHGVDHMQDVIGATPGLPPWETTVMERLQDVGYTTAAFGKIHMMPPKGLDETRLTMGKGARWTVAHGSPLGPSQLKYVFNGASEGAVPLVELYDLETDPQELINVAADPAYAGEVARHAQLLLDYRLKTETNAWKCGLAATTPQPLDPFGVPIA